MTSFFGRLARKAGRGLRRLAVRTLASLVLAILVAGVLLVLDALLLKNVQARGDRSGEDGDQA